MKGHKVLWVVCLACAMAFAVGACGGDDGGGGGSSSGTGQTKGAKAIDVKSMDNAKGNVTYCTGKDTSGDMKQGIVGLSQMPATPSHSRWSRCSITPRRSPTPSAFVSP